MKSSSSGFDRVARALQGARSAIDVQTLFIVAAVLMSVEETTLRVYSLVNDFPYSGTDPRRRCSSHPKRPPAHKRPTLHPSSTDEHNIQPIMATTSDPITPERFATAILDLPFPNLYSKAAEIRNSISHLKSSNEQMMPFADEGDQDCKEAMFENLTVIGRMNERIALLKGEVERRGGVWSEHAVGDGEVSTEGDGIVVNGNGHLVNGDVESGAAQRREPTGRFTDDELRRQLEAQMGGDDAEENDDGVHL